HFMRAKLSLEEDRYVVTTIGPQGFGILNSMVDANGLIIAPEDRMQIKAGEKVRVQILDRSFESAILENHQGVEAT
ncbi:MAG: hypothetical protein KAJ09_00180, partial [Deltaproteobacteria bacterium]|nr:hypothetical protein [Deltaproteobacteria bacterium]